MMTLNREEVNNMDVYNFKPMTSDHAEFYTKIRFDLVKETPKAIRIRIKKDLTVWMPKSITRGVKTEETGFSAWFWNVALSKNIQDERARQREKEAKIKLKAN